MAHMIWLRYRPGIGFPGPAGTGEGGVGMGGLRLARDDIGAPESTSWDADNFLPAGSNAPWLPGQEHDTVSPDTTAT